MPQGATSLAERADLAFQRTRELRAEFQTTLARFKAEREHARETVPHIRALFEALQLQPTLPTLWHAIELSDRYGSLEERTSILLLADAFFKAKGDFWNIATRRDEPATGSYPAGQNQNHASPCLFEMMPSERSAVVPPGEPIVSKIDAM